MMLHEWDGKNTFEASNEDNNIEEVVDSRLNKWSNTVPGKSMLAMKKLDYSIKKLRQCITISSLQKASLQVALALLEIASTKDCQNPFICLSQAAIFAAQGPKGGNNDEDFKKPLPRESDCSAEEAIQILGRADCLRALHFTNESIFLCSYVARVCCLHRDRQEPDHPWTPRWRIVGIMTYTISVAIDSSICSILQGEEMTLALDSWDKSVRAEIGRGRSDAIALQKSFGRRNSSSNSKFSSLQVDSTSKNMTSNESEDSWNDGDDGDYDDEYHSDQSFKEYDDDGNDKDDDEPLNDYEYNSDQEIEGSPQSSEHVRTDDDASKQNKLIENSSLPPLPPEFAHIPSVEI